MIINGDCLIEMKKLKANSVDAVISDPPYELGFMGKKWDDSGIAYNVDMWKQCLRILKPGGHLLSFGGTRTYHRMACAIEDAGFEIRDMIEWCYNSGFPKSLNVGKAVDKKLGNEREDLGEYDPRSLVDGAKRKDRAIGGNQVAPSKTAKLRATKGNSKWEGYGTALKPAHEPIVCATKPLTNKNILAILRDININLSLTIWQSLSELEKTDTSKLREMVSIHLNTVLLWQNILGELLKNENKSTISTESRPIIELKILNSLLLKPTLKNTAGKSQIYQNGIQEFQVNGLDLFAEIVESILVDEKKSMKDIQTLIAQELVILRKNKIFSNVKSAEKNLPTIILNANSALLNVLTGLTTTLEENELNTFVNFAEESLKQYLAEPQSIVTQNVWLKTIRKNIKHRPICLARKPLKEKSIVDQVLKTGTAGLNIDKCRIPYESEDEDTRRKAYPTKGWCIASPTSGSMDDSALNGRFPANLICQENSLEESRYFSLDAWNKHHGLLQVPKSAKSEKNKGTNNFLNIEICVENMAKDISQKKDISELIVKWLTGLFGKKTMEKYQVDISSTTKTETKGITILIILNSLQPLNIKEYIVDALKTKRANGGSPAIYVENTSELKQIITDGLTEYILGVKAVQSKEQLRISVSETNFHPTCKPIALMQYLITLVSKPGDTVIDPFAGSGSTLVACKMENRKFIGIEMTKEYIPIIEARLKLVQTKLI